jgi:hypothetical protein
MIRRLLADILTACPPRTQTQQIISIPVNLIAMIDFFSKWF